MDPGPCSKFILGVCARRWYSEKDSDRLRTIKNDHEFAVGKFVDDYANSSPYPILKQNRPFPNPHQPPSLPILSYCLPSAIFPLGIKPQTPARRKSLNRNHEPQIQRHNVSRQKIKFILRISRRTTPRRNRETPLSHISRRFHLHPPQPPSRIHNQVIALAVAPRRSHAQPKFGSLMQKRRVSLLPIPLP